MVMLMETPASTFYLNLNAENNNTYIASNGIAEVWAIYPRWAFAAKRYLP